MYRAMSLRSTPISTLSKVFILYFTYFIFLVEFPFLHGFPGETDSAVNSQSSEFIPYGSEDSHENVRHYHSFNVISYQICFLCAVNSSLFTNYLDNNYTFNNNNSSVLQFSWDENHQSTNLKRLPLLRAPPVV